MPGQITLTQFVFMLVLAVVLFGPNAWKKFHR
jgi:hypothetical protein